MPEGVLRGIAYSLFGDNNGNIGIGITNPRSSLEVAGDISVGGSILPTENIQYDLGSSNYRWKDLYLSGNTLILGDKRISATATGIQIKDADNDIPLDLEGFNVYASGSVGIGTTEPTFELDVVGDINFTGILYQNGTEFVSSEWTSNLNGSSLYYINNVGIGTNNPTSKLYVDGTLGVTGATTLSDTLSVSGASTLDSVDVTNNANVSGPLGVIGATTLGNVGINNNVTIGGTLDVTSISTLDSVNITNNTTIGGTLSISGASTLNSVSVTNNATIGGTLNVSSASTLNSVGVTNNATIGGTLGVSGASTLYSVGVTSNATVGGTLSVTGATTLSDTLSVSSASTLYSVGVTNNATVGGTLSVTGASTLDSVGVTNNTTIGGSLDVTGNTTVNNNVGIGTIYPAEKLHVEGNIYSSGNITASNLTILGDYVNLNTITSNTEQIVIINDGTGPALQVTQTGAQPIADFYDDNNVIALRIADGGYIGIGTTNPTEKLHVEGTLNITDSSILNSAAITNNATIGGTLSVSSASTLNSVGVTNNATVGGTLGVSGASTLYSVGVTNNATVGGTLGVTGATTLSDTLSVSSASTLYSVGVTNNATVGGTLSVTGASTLDSVGVTNNATVGGTLGVSGTSTLNSVGVTNNATVGGTLGVTGVSTLDSVGVTNNATVGGTLGVTGVSTLDSVYVTNNATVGGSLGVTGATVLGHTLSVSSSTTLDNVSIITNATIGGTLGVSGVSTLDSVGVTNNATVGGTLGVSGASTLDSVGVTNNATVGGTLGVSGASTLYSVGVTNNATVGGTLGVSGASTLYSVGVTNNATIGGTLGVTNNATIGGTLGVTGATTLSDTLSVSGASTLDSVGVTNNATVGGTLGVSGASTLDSVGVTNNATVGGTLGVSGASTLYSVGVTSNATVGGTLSVTGATTLSDTLSVSSASTLYSVGVTNNATVGGTLGVSGASTLDSVGVTNNATVGGSLDVTGNTTVNNNVGIGTTNPIEKLHVEGNIYSSGNITASNLTILGDYVTLNTVTSNTEQIVIINDGTGPALQVTQTGAQPIADFYDDNNVIALRIADGGYIGIGTTNPIEKLHVEGTSYLNGIVTTNNNNINVGSGTVTASIFSGTATQVSNTLTVGSYLTGDNFTGAAASTIAVDGTTTPDANKVVVRDASSYIFAGGVGIGTNSLATYELDVVGDINFTGTLYQNGTEFVSGGGGGGSSVWSTNSSDIYYTSGNVGIGTNSPAYTLDVNGTIFASNIIINNSNQYFSTANRLQVTPINDTIHLTSNNITTFTYTYNGIYKAEPLNTDVSINGYKLAYSNVEYKDYDVTYTNDYVNLTSEFTITISYTPDIDSVVDITIWPQYIEEGSVFGYSLQSFSEFIRSGDDAYYYKSGNVGIGTDTPTEKLHIYGGNSKFETNGNNTVSILANYNGNYTNALLYVCGTSNIPNIGGTIIIGPTTTDGIAFGAASGYYYMAGINSLIPRYLMWNNYAVDSHISFGGNIGVGLTFPNKPTYTLDVAGDINLTGTLYKNGTEFVSSTNDITASNINITNNATVGGTLGVTGTTTLSDNVGINVAPDASYSLYVNGNARIYNGGTYISGQDGTLTYTNSADDTYKQLYILRPEDSSYGWVLGNQTQTPTASDNDFYFWVLRDGSYSLAGYMQDNVDKGQMNFTGQHRTFINNTPHSEASNLEGLIVSANTNEYIKMTGGIEYGLNAITVNESLPVVCLCSKQKDKSCFGVISASEDPNKRYDEYGTFVSVFKKEEGDTRVYINSVGEGAIWVSDVNGTLESGDYITTSDITGYGMKQDDDILHNYTVAKITMDCDFNPPMVYKKQIMKDTEGKNILDEHGQIQWVDTNEVEPKYKTRYVNMDGDIITEEEYTSNIANNIPSYKAAFVGCTYHCG